LSLLIECPVCEESFWPASNQKYCSDKCREKAKRIRRKEEISEANKRWKAKNRDKINQKQREWRASKPKTPRAKQSLEERKRQDRIYKDKIRFGGNREKALIRDNYTCQLCGTKEMIDVHHIDKSGSSENPNNDLSNLVTLCRPCHQLQHKHDKPKTGQWNNCQYCGKKTFVLKKEIGRKKYCSVECADKAKIGVYKTSEVRNCLVCGKEFKATAQAIQAGKGKYCSPTCSQKGQSKKVTVNCLICGSEFKTIPSKIKVGKGKYCSKACYGKSKKKTE
jgi:5-methylcytosine-specific restriction endonuclease McrA